MLRDKATNRHKGFAYVEMADLEAIPSVLLMNEQVCVSSASYKRHRHNISRYRH